LEIGNWKSDRQSRISNLQFPIGLLLSFFLAGSLFAAPPETRKNSKDHQTYVHIPAGAFRMGCSDGDKECYEDEKPPHMVQISHDFWIGQTEVTVAAFQIFGSTNAVRLAGEQTNPKFPAMSMTWEEADRYCKWAGGRLPTEAEWEYAARGGTATVRYGELDAIAWTSVNSMHAVHESAQKKPNAYGLYDMLGNVWEWTNDWYGSKYYENSPAVDPMGPPAGDTLAFQGQTLPTRVLRGGAWIGKPGVARASYRYWFIPTFRVANIGFRCVLENSRLE
jgi:formylglycine-generating enzyme required for sulfatase activity